MTQLKDTKNWKITKTIPELVHQEQRILQRKLKPYGRRSGKTHKEQCGRPYKYLRNFVSGTNQNEEALQKQSVYLPTRWCTITHLEKNLIMVQRKLFLILG